MHTCHASFWGRRKSGSYLNTCFRQVYLHGDLLPGVDVGIMRLLKRPLQFFELSRCESGSNSSLFTFFRENSIMVAGIDFVG